MSTDGKSQRQEEPVMQGLDLRALRAGLLAMAVVVPLLLAGAGLAAGLDGLLGAAAGAALTVTFFAISIVVCAAVARRDPQLLLPAALGTYSIKIVGLAGLIAALRDTTVFDLSAFAWAVVVSTVVWVVAEVRWLWRAKILYVEPEPTDPVAPTPGSRA